MGRGRGGWGVVRASGAWAYIRGVGGGGLTRREGDLDAGFAPSHCGENDPFLPYVGPRFCHISGLNSPKSLFFPNSAKRRIAAVALVQQRWPWQMEKHREQTEQRVATCQALRQMHGSKTNGRATDHKQRCKNYFLSSKSGAVSTCWLKRWRRLHLFAQKVAQSPTPPTQKWGDSCEACLLIPASATCLRWSFCTFG